MTLTETLGGTLLLLALQMAPAIGPDPAQKPDPAIARKVAHACAADAAQYCPDSDDKGGVLRFCLAQHHSSLTLQCRRALAAAKGAAPGL